MRTVKGIYENGKIELLEEINYEKAQKILVTFLEEDVPSQDKELRQLSFTQPDGFLTEYLFDEREDLYQEYAEKMPK